MAILKTQAFCSKAWAGEKGSWGRWSEHVLNCHAKPCAAHVAKIGVAQIGAVAQISAVAKIGAVARVRVLIPKVAWQ